MSGGVRLLFDLADLAIAGGVAIFLACVCFALVSDRATDIAHGRTETAKLTAGAWVAGVAAFAFWTVAVVQVLELLFGLLAAGGAP